MGAKFSYEKNSFKKAESFLLISMVTFIPILVICGIDVKLLVLFVLWWILYAVIKSYSLDGVIVWEQDSIVIYRMKGNRKVPRWAYTLDEIESVSCTSEIRHTRTESIHVLVFTVVLASYKKRDFCFELDIDENFPVQQPEKFKEYIDGQPLMQICKYINERLGNYE